MNGRAPTTAEFKTVLANLQGLNLSGDLGYGPDISSVDNVRLAVATPTQFKPRIWRQVILPSVSPR